MTLLAHWVVKKVKIIQRTMQKVTRIILHRRGSCLNINLCAKLVIL